MQKTLGLKSPETPLGQNLSKRIHKSWYNNDRIYDFLNGKDMAYIVGMLSSYKKQGKVIYPESDKILRALKLPMSKVRVVILGQDPYFAPAGQAEGLSFSCGKSISPSLASIFECIYRTVYEEDKSKLIEHYIEYYPGTDFPPTDPIQAMPISLVRWAKQGILLLNRYLTVEAGKRLSHAELGWHKFTDLVIEEIDKQPQPTIFLLWGKEAQKVMKKIKHSKVMVAEHPAAPAYNDSLWYCSHFVDVLSHFPDIKW